MISLKEGNPNKLGGKLLKNPFAKILLVLFLVLISACQSTPDLSNSNELFLDQPENTPEPQELVTVTINSSNQVNYAPIYFAESEGYFEEYGIQLEVLNFTGVTQAVPLLVSGQLDVYAGSISAGLLNIFSLEPNVKAVADRGQFIKGECTFLAILIRKDLFNSNIVTGPADLEGLTIAANETAARGYFLSKYLEKADLTFDDVILSDIPSLAFIDAFDNKTVDAIVVPEINLSRLLLNGNAVVLSKAEDEIGPYQSAVLAFGPRLIKDNPEIGIKFMAAYLKGVHKYNEGKTDENLKILANQTGEDIDLLRQACWMSIRGDGWIDFNNVEAFQQWSVEQGHLDHVITEEQFWDPKFIEAALSLINEGE